MIYLDNAATSFPKPEAVYQALDRFARHELANPGRPGTRWRWRPSGRSTTPGIGSTSSSTARRRSAWIFTLNCTDALNMAIKGVLKPGDHVVTTDLEHNCVSRPLRAMELAGTITPDAASADAGGTIDPDDVRERAHAEDAARRPDPRVSNVLGTVQPIAEIGRIVRDMAALFLVDAAQTAGVVPIDLAAQCIDLLAFPGHKSLFGPTGTGALYVGPRAKLRPWREGGTGGDSSSETQPQEFPYFLEGGTPNVLGVAGLVAGLQFVEERGPASIYRHESELRDRLRRRLEQIDGVTIFGHGDAARCVGTLSFKTESLAPADLGGILDQSFDIAVRPGLHCAPYIHRSLGTFPDGTVRVSVGPFNTPDELDRLADAVKEILS